MSTSSPLGDAPLETERAPFSGVTPPPAVLGATVFGAIISLSPLGDAPREAEREAERDPPCFFSGVTHLHGLGFGV